MTLPKEWEGQSDWDSHLPMLWLAINRIPHGAFYEYGMGDGSTPRLKRWYTEINNYGKEYYSLETNKDWANKFITDEYKETQRKGAFLFKNHLIYLLEEYVVISQPDSLIFVDCAPADIRKDIIRRNCDAKAIIIHDTEVGAEYVYGLSDILSTFKYRLDYKPEGKPHTTIISNTTDVSQWETDLRSISSMIADEPNGTSH